MRTTAFVLFAALVVIACGSTPAPRAPAVSFKDVQIELPPPTRERLELGLPLHVELIADGRSVGDCTLAFDLWAERYKVALSSRHIVYAADPTSALRNCVDLDKLDTLPPALRVREMPHLYQPRADYPVF